METRLEPIRQCQGWIHSLSLAITLAASAGTSSMGTTREHIHTFFCSAAQVHQGPRSAEAHCQLSFLIVPGMAPAEVRVDLVGVGPGLPVAGAPPPKCIPLAVRAPALVLLQPPAHKPLLLVDAVAVRKKG